MPSRSMSGADEVYECESSDDETFEQDFKNQSADGAASDTDDDHVKQSDQNDSEAAVPDATAAQDDDDEEGEEEEENEREEEGEEEESEAQLATGDNDVAEEMDDTPEWLVEAADACGLSEGSAEDSPLGVKKPKKPNLRLSQLARSIKSDTARKVIFDPTLELSAARDEIARLRRSNQMQAQFIETLKHKNEVLEQRLALRDFV